MGLTVLSEEKLMNFILLAVGIVLIVAIFFVVLDSSSQLKIRVRTQWGKLPRQTRFDKEESLKAVW